LYKNFILHGKLEESAAEYRVDRKVVLGTEILKKAWFVIFVMLGSALNMLSHIKNRLLLVLYLRCRNRVALARKHFICSQISFVKHL
jgi:hypothetical protein